MCPTPLDLLLAVVGSALSGALVVMAAGFVWRCAMERALVAAWADITAARADLEARVAALAAWRDARPGETPGELTPEDDRPQPLHVVSASDGAP